MAIHCWCIAIYNMCRMCYCVANNDIASHVVWLYSVPILGKIYTHVFKSCRPDSKVKMKCFLSTSGGMFAQSKTTQHDWQCNNSHSCRPKKYDYALLSHWPLDTVLVTQGSSLLYMSNDCDLRIQATKQVYSRARTVQ